VQTIHFDLEKDLCLEIIQPNPTSLLQSWYYIAAIILIPDWLCPSNKKNLKLKITELISQNQQYIKAVIDLYNNNNQWTNSSASQLDLLDSFASIASCVDLVDKQLSNEIEQFLGYTQYVFCTEHSKYSLTIKRAKILIEELSIDFGYTADYLDEVATNESLMYNQSVSLKETKESISYWIKQQYHSNINKEQWLQNLRPPIKEFVIKNQHSETNPMFSLWTVSQCCLGITIIDQKIYLCWKGANPPVDIRMKQTLLIPVLNRMKNQDFCWKLPKNPSYTISFQWNGSSHFISLD
jgi:hypothetical protein